MRKQRTQIPSEPIFIVILYRNYINYSGELVYEYRDTGSDRKFLFNPKPRHKPGDIMEIKQIESNKFIFGNIINHKPVLAVPKLEFDSILILHKERTKSDPKKIRKIKALLKELGNLTPSEKGVIKNFVRDL